ncbi:MAG TPA: flagellar basal-body rod protein FlgF [Rhodopila sp.]|jgi:flagellar basal-body rod protein FlgF|nr:flagellar basal-body rod protein FlgF [Rhodopila sp.]
MESASYIALSRMVAQQRALEVRADNIANADTPGFKAESVMFSDYLVRQHGVATPPGGQIVQMVQDRATWRDFQEGQMVKTGNALDLALRDDGFFAVNTPRGVRYSRSGRFTISPAGQIVDNAGNSLLGTDGRPIGVTPDETNLTVATDGTISSNGNAIGKVRVVRFDDQQSMQAEGSSLFNTNQPPRAIAQPDVMQGAVEGANVQPIAQLTDMMGEMREYQFASQFVDAETKRQQSAIDQIGRKGAGA